MVLSFSIYLDLQIFIQIVKCTNGAVPLLSCASGEQEVVGCKADFMDLDRVIIAQGNLGVVTNDRDPAFRFELLKAEETVAGNVQDVAASGLEA